MSEDAAPPADAGAAPAAPSPAAPAGVGRVIRAWERQRIHLAMAAAALGALAALASVAAPWWQLRGGDTMDCESSVAASGCSSQASGPGGFAMLATVAAALLLVGLLVILLARRVTWASGAGLAGGAAALLVLALATDTQPAAPFFVIQAGPGWGRAAGVVSAVLAGLAAVAAGSVPDGHGGSRRAA